MILLAVAAAILITFANVAEWLYFSDFEYRVRTRKFNRVLHEKQVEMVSLMNGMKPLLATEEHHGSVPETNIFSVAERNKITILEFLDNSLIDWSDNDFDVPEAFIDSIYRKPMVFLQNGWFLPATIEAGNEKIVGLLRVRTDFSLTNDIIKSGFEKEYGVPQGVGFSFDTNDSEFHIRNKEGTFLFSLIFPETKEATEFILVPLLLWAVLFIVVLMMWHEVVKTISSRGKGDLATLLTLAFCGIAYLLFILVGPPDVFPLTELFSPYRFSMNLLIPTLGHLFYLGILCVFLAGIFYRYYPVKELKPDGDHDFSNYLPIAFFFVLSAILTAGIHHIFSQLLLTSNINFLPYRILELNIFSFVAFVAVLLLILLPVMFMLRIIRILNAYKVRFIVLAFLPSLLVAAIIFRNDIRSLIPVEFFFIMLTAGIWMTGKRGTRNFALTVIFSFLFGLYALICITVFTEEKTTEKLKIQAVSLSTENDPVAEHLLLDLWPVIEKDTILGRMMMAGTFNENSEDVENISDYLRETYFSGYWANFNFNIVLCRNDDPLRVGPGNEIFPLCFNFFDERIRRDGHKLTGTEFYFIDNQRGRSFYLGRLNYRSGDYVHGLFIELYGDVNVFQPGYSALLIDKEYHGYAGLKDYSFAKYINGELVLQNGDFPYHKTDEQYMNVVADYDIFRSEGFQHVLFKNGNATVLISRPVIKAGDLIISFAYLFAFVLLFSNLFVMVIRVPSIRGNVFNFRQKLQISYISILLFSFILIGVVVAYLTISQYKTKHYENVKEKLNSVYLELDSRLSMERHIDSDWSNSSFSSLNELMISLSNIFNTDINLYDVNGELIATSRPEIFIRNLISTRINKMAWINLKDLTVSEYYHREKIGNLEYLSAYMPFYNGDDRLLAYLNLPYFRIESVLAQEISNLIVAVLNFTLLLILATMSIAVVISGRLTAPLSMLGEGLASVKLGRKTEHLSYEGDDEIGELVSQYNRMLDELEDSAGKLANSEREYAWREMAKQIAHEIKNPLTPMKLNVQQLLKSWKDNAPGFDEHLEHFARNQIEYIDNLSSIASAFSSFAKMPGAKPSEVNLIDQIRITLEIFRDAENITFKVKWPEELKVVIHADKEHLNGIFSNLIKNGIQSIPAGKQGVITVAVEVRRDKAIVKISDNGSGIPVELQDKMFTPNFTTKSSGTGLGLSIVRKYAETAGGRVWFESELNRGTTFFVELPLKYTVEKPV